MSINTKTQAESMLKVLDYTKADKAWFDERGLSAGYHSVLIQGEKVKGQRDPELRLAKIDYDFSGKRVLDIGCSNGGLLHALSGRIAFGVGVDFNAKCINAANALKAVNSTANIHFYSFNLDKEELTLLSHFIFAEPVDICFFLNISLWVERWQEVFLYCSTLTNVMLFEAHGNEAQQLSQIKFISSVYKNVQLLSEQSDDDPTYTARKMFLCSERLADKPALTSSNSFKYLAERTETSVKEALLKAFPEEPLHNVKLFPNTHESTVVDVNDDFIIKFAKESRGGGGIIAEQKVTDFLRDRVLLPLPAVTVYQQPVLFSRYKKLTQSTFDSAKYEQLPATDKESLAQSLAAFIAACHSISETEIKQNNLQLSPSWEIKPQLIREQLVGEQDIVIRQLLNEVVSNHEVLSVPSDNMVFGHFDLHGSNILFSDDHKTVTGVLDFGNCKMGDLHQDLSVMNLSSPDLALRILKHYSRITGRQVNTVLVQHYTTIFYLNLLAGLRRKHDERKFAYWLKEFHGWYNFMVQQRASQRVDKHPVLTKIPLSWKKWLASNLMKGANPAGITAKLKQQGYSDLEIATELAFAMQHPYIQAGMEIFHTLKKRNWLLDTCNKLHSLDPGYATTIDVIETPAFDVFIKRYYSKHQPVLLKNGFNHWPALAKWAPDYLLENLGEREVEVQFGRDSDPNFERNAYQHKKKMLMADFIDLVMNNGETNNYYMTANNTKNSMSSIAELFDDIADFGEGYRDLSTGKSGAYFWFGPKGTYTPIHHDLTNNMLLQMYGRKKVTLIPAYQVPYLYNEKGVFSTAQFPNFDRNRHPLMEKLTPMEVIIEPGDAIFIPIGWWHCVESLDVSISLCFTNFNAPNSFSSEFPRRE